MIGLIAATCNLYISSWHLKHKIGYFEQEHSFLYEIGKQFNLIDNICTFQRKYEAIHMKSWKEILFDFYQEHSKLYKQLNKNIFHVAFNIKKLDQCFVSYF